MQLHLLDNRVDDGYTTFGVIWSKGENKSDKDYIIKKENGEFAPVQSRNTAYYPDGSVKWTAHTINSAWVGHSFNLVMETPGSNHYFSIPQFVISENENEYEVSTKGKSITIPKKGDTLFKDYVVQNKTRIERAYPILKIERREGKAGISIRQVIDFTGIINKVTFEERGPFRITIKYEGIHFNKNLNEKLIPFIIRLQIGVDDSEIKMMHTMFFDGVEERDLMKGIGIRFISHITGKIYNRHIKIPGDAGAFNESCAQIIGGHPKMSPELYQKQFNGEEVEPTSEDKEKIKANINDMPFWDTFSYTQEFHRHFSIRKKLYPVHLCWIDSLEGTTGKGIVNIGGENGNLSFAIRDFDKKTPAGFLIKGLTKESVETTGWFYSPEAKAFDFSHYATRGYRKVCYEGYDYLGASAYGIAVTSELHVKADQGVINKTDELEQFYEKVNQPAMYVASPKEYHEKHAFGFWSLPETNTEVGKWLEHQLNLAAHFYINEVKQRNWFGLFNYGDFMHTYDSVRHNWKYDTGGFAWDNTELVPTLWLWLYFMRSGNEDIFTLAEKLSRHASEVDVYHFGKYKGMGSRHNVRHWGCPCKEARIAMAGHHRYYYYLTGDFRLEDIFDELKDNEETFLRRDPLGDFYDRSTMVFPSHARSGPDWSSLCSNWMTQWERFNDRAYLNKIEIGLNDIKTAPLQLISGPDFEFDPQSKHLRYIGEVTSGGTHLQICMGGPSIWMEISELTGNEEFKKMIADHGRFYFLSAEERGKESRGIVGKREFSFPYFAASMGAYSAWYRKDKTLARQVWRILLAALIEEHTEEGFTSHIVKNEGNKAELKEIPGLSTNFTAQWCLNIIIALEFIRDAMPVTMKDMRSLIAEEPEGVFRK